MAPLDIDADVATGHAAGMNGGAPLPSCRASEQVNGEFETT